jgi:hypothetical protein
MQLDTVYHTSFIVTPSLTVMSNPVLRSWPRSSRPWPVVMARRKLQQQGEGGREGGRVKAKQDA